MCVNVLVCGAVPCCRFVVMPFVSLCVLVCVCVRAVRFECASGCLCVCVVVSLSV